MQTRITLLLIACCALTVSAPSAMANNSNEPLVDYNNAIWASAGADSLGYKESVPAPDLTDSERDRIASLAAGVNYMDRLDLYYFALEGSYSTGNAHYNGSYFYSPTTPLQGTTSEDITYVDGKIGKGLPLGRSVMLTPYVELGYRYWRRDLGGSEVEDYEHFDGLGGVMVQVSPLSNLILSAYGSAGTTFNPEMKTAGNTYDLGTSAVYKAGAKLGYNLTESTEIFTTLDFEHFSYGQSPVQIDGTYEPTSNTDETALRVGLAYHFQ